MADLNLGDMRLDSPAFDDRGQIPSRYSHAGGNHSPELRWTDVPAGTRELVVVVHDPDAPMVDGFTHWVALGIDPSSDRLPEDAATGFTPGINSAGDAAYMGPAPPQGHGTHHYFFHLFALDKRLATSPLPHRGELLEHMEGHVLCQARLVGTYSTD